MKPEALEGVLERLEEFVQPFAASLEHAAQREHAEEYVAGLVSNVKRKNIETIAYLHEQDRQPLQKFIGQKPWDVAALDRRVGPADRRGDGRSRWRAGLRSLGGAQARQGVGGSGPAVVWTCGQGGQLPGRRVPGLRLPQGTRLGRYAAVLAQGMDEGQEAVQAGGNSEGDSLSHASRTGLGNASEHRAVLPHAWVTGDDEMGRNSDFREQLRAMNEQYLLAVPSNTLVRDLDAARRPTVVRGSRRKSLSSVRTVG